MGRKGLKIQAPLRVFDYINERRKNTNCSFRPKFCRKIPHEAKADAHRICPTIMNIMKNLMSFEFYMYLWGRVF